MIAESVRKIEGMLADEALVLDVGGYSVPWRRADWVIDLMPYEGRGPHGAIGRGEQRFSRDTWVQRDICSHEPLPFEDNQFDFAVCSHTLEDVRDPVWVCHELTRVAKAGYIEVPSRLEEQSYGFQGPWAGWGHHHWFVDVREEEIEFVFKHHVLHNRASDHFPPGFQQTLSEEGRVQQLWWEGGFAYRERLILDAWGLDRYLSEYVSAHSPVGPSRSLSARVTRKLGAGIRRLGSHVEGRARRM